MWVGLSSHRCPGRLAYRTKETSASTRNAGMRRIGSRVEIFRRAASAESSASRGLSTCRFAFVAPANSPALISAARPCRAAIKSDYPLAAIAPVRLRSRPRLTRRSARSLPHHTLGEDVITVKSPKPGAGLVLHYHLPLHSSRCARRMPVPQPSAPRKSTASRTRLSVGSTASASRPSSAWVSCARSRARRSRTSWAVSRASRSPLASRLGRGRCDGARPW